MFNGACAVLEVGLGSYKAAHVLLYQRCTRGRTPELSGQVSGAHSLNFILSLRRYPSSFTASEVHFVHRPVLLQDNGKNKFCVFSSNVFLFSLFIIELLIHLEFILL